MQLSARSKFWLVVALILSAGFIGGVLGNWIFIYMLDKYYGIAAGNYAAAPGPANIIIRQDSKDNAGSIADIVGAEGSLAGIFKKQPDPKMPYLPKDKVGQALAVTADGWLVTVTNLQADSNGRWSDYVVVAGDRKVYSIERVVTASDNRFTFIRLAERGANLPVRDFVLSGNLTVGQELTGIEWRGVIERGIVSRMPANVRSSEAGAPELSIFGLGDRNAVLFDGNGRIAGLTRGRNVVPMDSIKVSLGKLLSDGVIKNARLGARYIPLADAAPAASGALLAGSAADPAVVSATPAAKAGLRAGDIIVSLDGVVLEAETDLAALLEEYNPGDEVRLVFMRNGQTRQLDVTLDELKEK